jgi:hypothetical protein
MKVFCIYRSSLGVLPTERGGNAGHPLAINLLSALMLFIFCPIAMEQGLRTRFCYGPGVCGVFSH